MSAICPDGFSYEFASSPEGERLSIGGDSRTVGVDHGPDGTLVWSWDTDGGYDEDEIEEFVEQVPKRLIPRLDAMTKMDGYERRLLSAVMWRMSGDDAWSTPQYHADPWCDPVSTLSDLLDPSPGNLWLPAHFHEEDGSFARADAIRQVLALRPLTEETVRAINPSRSLADVADDVAAVGYRPAPIPVPLDRGIGEGEPLVARAPDYDSTSLTRFYFEQDGTGHHRILIHHSGKAVHVCGTETGAAVVQREPDGSPAQLFLLEEYRDDGWHALPELVHTVPDYGGEFSQELSAEAFRIRAKDSGLVLGRPDRLDEPVRLEEPRDDPAQAMTTWLEYGYGVWAQLPIGVRPPAAPYEPAVMPV
ncbi:RICIN domain-containing protein [Streptomyces sp. NPDC001297]|uniref:RICIN domain-containing protein n=1 Tax=Streptomyces sp. NPDC001297 TaxID=3364559 RepID=UPI00367FF2FF